MTVSRLVMVGIIMLLLTVSFPLSKTLALLVFAAAGITDYLDGHYARSRNLITPFGQLMDPLADKIMVCAVFISFTEIAIAHSGTFLHRGALAGGIKVVPLVPAWIVVVIIAREFLVTGLRLLAVNRGMVISAGRWGKHKTVWQIVAIVILLIGLSLRSDLLPLLEVKVQAQFDFIFPYAAHAISLAVAIVTVASGYLYFTKHRELFSRL